MNLKLTEPRLRRVGGVRLVPGVNRLSDAEAKKVTGHPIGRALAERGVIVKMEAKPAAKAEDAPKRGRPSNDDLVAEIAETYDVERLRELSGHKTKKVSEAAKAQIEKIDAMAADSEPKE